MTTCPQCGTVNPGDALFCGGCGKRLAEQAPAAGLATISAMETIHSLPTARSGRSDHGIDLAEGEEFAGRYVIDRLIGKGGMGVVYRAQDKLTSRSIALKLIRRDRLGGEGAVKRLIAEGVTTRDIRNDNVVAVYDVGEAEGLPFVSMEYLEAVSLRDWHRRQVQERRDVPLPIAARIIWEILVGLDGAHAKGVIHRDLKPENILLLNEPGPDGVSLKIVDFGIARAAGVTVDSGTGTGLGTPRYMAPEQITNADSAGPSADLYSLSIIFYELLVDVLPQGHWQPPSGGRGDIPLGIDRLIERGLANRAASRPQSAAEYRQLLAAAAGIAAPQQHQIVMPVVRPQVTGGQSGFPTWLKWASGGAVGLLLVAVVSAAIDDGSGGSPGTVSAMSNPGGYAALSGSWVDGQNGASYTVQVGSDGSFSGSGMVGAEPVSIQGAFQGSNARYVVGASGLQYPGQLQWDGQCHLNWRAEDGSTGGQLHVNHAPGAPCP